MSAERNVAPALIIKKKKHVGHNGHHGGAWKVAYADFVTAMMAFFLLMWLLNATTETQRKGIADYFSPSIPVARVSGGGDGLFTGDTLFAEQVLPTNRQDLFEHAPKPAEPHGHSEHDASSFESVVSALTGTGGESLLTKTTRPHILTRITDEGLVIELFDLEDSRLFGTGTDTPNPLLISLSEVIATVSNLVTNSLVIEGHTRSRPIVVKSNQAWHLSTSRSHQMRRLLVADGVASDRIQRITGHADRTLAVEDPLAPRNNRIEVILLRSDLP